MKISSNINICIHKLDRFDVKSLRPSTKRRAITIQKPELFNKALLKGKTNNEIKLLEFILSSNSFNLDSSFDELENQNQYKVTPKHDLSSNYYKFAKAEKDNTSNKDSLSFTNKFMKEIRFKMQGDSFSSKSNEESFLEKIYESNESSEEEKDENCFTTKKRNKEKKYVQSKFKSKNSFT